MLSRNRLHCQNALGPRSWGFLFFRTLVKNYEIMKKAITKAGKWVWGVFVAILTYIFLMIDRAVLIPFQNTSSYSVTELQKKPDRYSAYAMIRVSIAVTGTAIYLLIKYLF